MAVNIDQANTVATTRMMEARPVLVGLGTARDVIPGMHENLLLHAGPPITWARMSGPLRGAIIGALIFEGRAADAAEAEALATSGDIEFAPCHHHNAVGPMAGVTSPSMAVYIIENQADAAAGGGNRAFSNLNEGYGKVLRYGAYQEDVQARLRWMHDVMAPVLGDAIVAAGGLDIRALLAEALHMGDEGHNRNKAGSILYTAKLAPHIARVAPDGGTAGDIIAALGENALSVLNPVMAACKAMCDAGHGVEGSTIVSTMARNGTDFGIRVSGLGNQWFTAPAQVPDGLYFPNFSFADANADIGDSTITETAGHRRLCHGRGPGHRDVRQRHAQRRGQHDHGDVRNQLRGAQGVHHSRPGLPRHAHRHRPAQGGGNQHHAAHQHGHRPQGSRRGPGRRGSRAAAHGDFRRSIGSVCGEVWVLRE